MFFLLNLILANSDIVIAVVSSSIASTLLEGGCTAHLTFKLPLNVLHQKDPTCYTIWIRFLF